jgi:hypothetical protein
VTPHLDEVLVVSLDMGWGRTSVQNKEWTKHLTRGLEVLWSNLRWLMSGGCSREAVGG